MISATCRDITDGWRYEETCREEGGEDSETQGVEEPSDLQGNPKAVQCQGEQSVPFLDSCWLNPQYSFYMELTTVTYPQVLRSTGAWKFVKDPVEVAKAAASAAVTKVSPKVIVKPIGGKDNGKERKVLAKKPVSASENPSRGTLLREFSMCTEIKESNDDLT